MRALDSSQSLKILVVEDEPIVGRIFCMMLSSMGHLPELAHTGQEALQMFSFGYDFILMDIGLPDTTGIAVSAEIQKRQSGNRRVPIVAITAYTKEEVVQKCLEAGILEVITKPIHAFQLQQVITRFSKSASQEQTGLYA